VVVWGAKAKAFVPAEPMTASRIAGRAQRAIGLRSFSPHGAANCEDLSLADALAVRPLLRLHIALIAPDVQASGSRTRPHASRTAHLRLPVHFRGGQNAGAITTILHNSTTAVALSYDRLGGIKVMAQ
jgi:hypothetical protein